MLAFAPFVIIIVLYYLTLTTMDKDKNSKVEELLEKEIDEINDADKKERMKYLLSEYSKPKFRTNGLVYVFFITLIICLSWQNLAQKSYIEEQQEEMNSLILLMICTSPEFFPNDSVFEDTIEPYDFELSRSDEPVIEVFI